MNGKNASAVWIFIGLLLVVVFVVGIMVQKDPTFLTRRYHYDYALEQFGDFCAQVWLPAGIIGIPVFLISLIVSLVRERKEK